MNLLNKIAALFFFLFMLCACNTASSTSKPIAKSTPAVATTEVAQVRVKQKAKVEAPAPITPIVEKKTKVEATALIHFKKFREGDLIFQSMPEHMPLVQAIESCTRSCYSHVGIVVKQNGQLQVLEAIGPVMFTSLKKYLARGRRDRYAIYRFKKEHQPKIPALVKACRRYIGRPYDLRYRFDEWFIYCSELVWHGWKKSTGEDLGKSVAFKELNWQPNAEFIKKLEGSDIVPLERKMITPWELSQAKELKKIFDNGMNLNQKF